MDLQDIYEKFNVEEYAVECDNELQDFWAEQLKSPYELGIFPEPDPDNDESHFYITVDITSKKTKLDEERAQHIADAVKEKFFFFLNAAFKSSELKALEKSFRGVQVFLNGNKVC